MEFSSFEIYIPSEYFHCSAVLLISILVLKASIISAEDLGNVYKYCKVFSTDLEQKQTSLIVSLPELHSTWFLPIEFSLCGFWAN